MHNNVISHQTLPRTYQSSYPNLHTATDNYMALDSSLVIISKEEEYENDKFRIRKKFKFFNQKPNAFSQPLIPTHKAIKAFQKDKHSYCNNNNNGVCNTAKSNNKFLNLVNNKTIHNNIKINLQNKSKDKTIKQSNTSKDENDKKNIQTESSRNSDVNTEKESKNCIMSGLNKQNLNLIFPQNNTEVTNESNNNNNDNNNNNEEEKEINILEEIANLKDIRESVLKGENVLTPNNKTTNNNNESVFSSYHNIFSHHSSEQNNSQNNSNYNSSIGTKDNTQGISSLFQQTYAYNISSRLLNDEDTHHVIIFPPEQDKRFMFISHIELNNKINTQRKENGKQLYKRMLNMSMECFYHLLFMLYNDYHKLMNINKAFRSKINSCLTHCHNGIITQFKEKYSDILKLDSVIYKCKNCVNTYNNSVIALFDMIIISRLIEPSKYYLSYIISYNYSFSHNDTKTFNNTFQFDIRPKGKEATWFSSEIEEYNYSYKRFCYCQPVSSFTTGDAVQFRINLFSAIGKVDPGKLKWKELEIVEDIQKGLYEKKQQKTHLVYDKLRNSEIENIAHVWKDGIRGIIQVNDDNMIKHQQVLLSFINLFEKYFDIIEVLYDVSKFFYFKIKMQARRIGLLTKNKFINLDIEIKERKSVISNECQSLFFLNHNSYRDKYQIREGIIVIFYITDI